MKNTRNPVEFVEDPAARTVTITISGTAYRNLGKVARLLTDSAHTLDRMGIAMPEDGVSRSMALGLVAPTLYELADAEGTAYAVKEMLDGDVDELALLFSFAAFR